MADACDFRSSTGVRQLLKRSLTVQLSFHTFA
jgi:hypothetical protein